jgi:hypothetical protein
MASYEIVVYECGVRKEGVLVAYKADVVAAFTRYVVNNTGPDGFYVDDKSATSYSVFDLSQNARYIRLFGYIDEEIKAGLKTAFTGLLPRS